jgi:hypothetical protein
MDPDPDSGPDPDLDPAILVCDLQESSKSLTNEYSDADPVGLKHMDLRDPDLQRWNFPW